MLRPTALTPLVLAGLLSTGAGLVLASPASAQTAPCDAYSGSCPTAAPTVPPTGTGGAGGEGGGTTGGGTSGGGTVGGGTSGGGTAGGGTSGGGATGGGTGGATEAGGGSAPGSLPFTGGEVVLMSLVGAGALAAGSVLVVAGRRRPQAESA